MEVTQADGSRAGERAYEPPALTIHGSVVEATKASVFGVLADQNIPAGATIFGKTSL